MHTYLGKINIYIALTVILLAGTMLQATPTDKFSQDLAEQISQMADDESVSVILHLAEQADISSLDRDLTSRRATRALRHQVIISELRRVATETQPALRAELERLRLAGELEGFTFYWITNCAVVRGTRRAIMDLAGRDDVNSIEANFVAELIRPVRSRPASALDENEGVPTGIRAVGAARVWHELGYTGAGRIVGNIDTGVDGNHPALASRWRGLTEPWQECWLDVVGENTTFPEDGDEHGTHTMGTICGNSTASNDSIGVAPGAQWIASNGINQNTSATTLTNDIIQAFQWFSDPDSNEFTLDDVPDVVQNSWGVHGGFPGFSDCYQNWNDVIVNCEAAGVVVVFSAGNEGPSSNSLRSPATIEIDSVTVFSVGAVDADSDTIQPYVITDFSSRGPSSCTPMTAIKPEVCAPGDNVYSSIPGTTSQPNRYARYNGTSMAGPHVAGIVALMREANPNAEVREIKSILMRTAIDHGVAGEDNTYGFGFVDAYQAVLEISANRGIVRGHVTDEVSGEPIAGALVLAGDNFRRSTDSEGFYQMSLPGDSLWHFEASSYGYFVEETELFVGIEDTLTLDLALDRLPSGTLAGRVAAGADYPVEGASIQFLNVPLDVMIADENGEFGRTVPGDSIYELRIEFHDVRIDTDVVVPLDGALELDIHLNSPRALAEGPDLYGYKAHDLLDGESAPAFDWVEISPSQGGPGLSALPAPPAHDASFVIDMPFPFVYYGESFDTLTVNENGWISTATGQLGFFANFAIPSIAGPSGMIAPFWDNLYNTGDAEGSWWYDETHGRVIIEFYRMKLNAQSETAASFQVQIFDEAVRPTSTGDCEILFLYDRIDPAFTPTVGIENSAETIGLQLQLNNDFGNHTWLIRAGSAILFSTSDLGAVSGTVAGHPVPEDYTSATVSIEGLETNVNGDGTFLFEAAPTGAHSITVALPGYETITESVTIEAGQTADVEFEIWRLDPPRNLTWNAAETWLHFEWDAPESISGGLDEFAEYHVYSNGEMITVTQEEFFEDEFEPGIYEVYVVAVYEGGASEPSPSVEAESTVGVGIGGTLPTEFALSPAFPNPFNAETTLKFALPHDSRVTLLVYDMLGRQTAQLADQAYAAGYHSFHWNAGNLPSGLYFVAFEADDFRQIRKVMLLK